MARYTYSETVHVPQGHLHKGVTEFLNSCDYDVIYLKSDYIMARETVGTGSLTGDKTTQTLA